MKFDSASIQHLATLARIELTEAERDLFREQLASVLSYVEKLQRTDITGVLPANELPAWHHSARPDQVAASGLAQRLIGQAPVRRDNYIVVPPVLSETKRQPTDSSSEPI